jgi:hypothetical protein
VIPLVWGGIAFLAILLIVAVCGTHGDRIQNSRAYKVARVWGDRLMHGALILFVACMAVFVPAQIFARVAISKCGIFNEVMDSPFGLARAEEIKVRGKIGCPAPATP